MRPGSTLNWRGVRFIVCLWHWRTLFNFDGLSADKRGISAPDYRFSGWESTGSRVSWETELRRRLGLNYELLGTCVGIRMELPEEQPEDNRSSYLWLPFRWFAFTRFTSSHGVIEQSRHRWGHFHQLRIRKMNLMKSCIPGVTGCSQNFIWRCICAAIFTFSVSISIGLGRASHCWLLAVGCRKLIKNLTGWRPLPCLMWT